MSSFLAIGLDPTDANGVYDFSDPLSASFGGLESGNRSLREETADTLTYAVVFQPKFLPGFYISIDRWQIEIDNAIERVSDQNIVDGCYSAGVGLNTIFCDLQSRNTDSSSAQYGGFDFIRSTSINFVKQEVKGVDGI